MLLYRKIFRTSDQLCRDFPKKLVSFTRNVVSGRAAIRSCHCHPVKACFWNFWSLDAVYIRKFLMCESKGRSITFGFAGGCYRQLPAQALLTSHISQTEQQIPEEIWPFVRKHQMKCCQSYQGLLLLSLPFPGSRNTCSRRQGMALTCPNHWLWAAWPFECCTPATTTCPPCGCSSKGCQGRRLQPARS